MAPARPVMYLVIPLDFPHRTSAADAKTIDRVAVARVAHCHRCRHLTKSPHAVGLVLRPSVT